MNEQKDTASEARAQMPIEIISNGDIKRVALPPSWNLVEKDDERLLDKPRRKRADVRLHDVASFTDYIKRHGSLADSTLWCQANYEGGKVEFIAILNDHGEVHTAAAWRDHIAKFAPEYAEEWKRWNAAHKQLFTQPEFAAFIEENIKDIVGGTTDGLPTGGEMLEMALSFEANQDFRFKSAIRLQSGGIQMSFTQTDDSQTLAKMKMFERFAIGIPVFWNGDAYRIEARLRYRVREGKLTFWYELIRQDKTLEAATKTIIQLIKDNSGTPLFFGDPF
ncbi:MAG: hypothetical protein A3K04_02370 [Gallionellales bacterium RBG_16_56_9]|nr:MAG: hypothetical protein A3K04_02370 [Gallionellales bacterium RBG_16_56_9]